MNSNIKTPGSISIAFSAALLLTCVCAGYSAFAGEEVRSETVKFNDLNVDSREGAQALYRRIQAAAKRVCYDSDPVRHTATPACIWKAENNAVGKVNVPQLTAYYKIKTKTKTKDSTQELVAAR